MIQITECPRDAMQGIKTLIPTDIKIAYLNQLLKVGFNTIDCGSFVSPKAMPQMADTSLVLKGIKDKGNNRLLAIIANIKGAELAAEEELVDILGFPFSISETFQQRNANSSIADSFEDLYKIQEIAMKSSKELLIYISMGFGNPYNDPYDAEIVLKWVDKIKGLGVKTFSLSDTIGAADIDTIDYIFSSLIKEHPELEFGAHFHSRPENAHLKLEAALNAGCKKFDSAFKGIGGCPMASDDLTGNTATEVLTAVLEARNLLPLGINQKEFQTALFEADRIFTQYH